MGLKDYLAGFAVSGQGAEGGSGIIAGVGGQTRLTEVTAKAVLSPAQALSAHTHSKSLLHFSSNITTWGLFSVKNWNFQF